MVVSQNNQNGCGCGVNKCMNCTWCLICAKSPYCCINGGGSCADTQKILDAISNLSQDLAETTSTILSTIGTGFTFVNNHIDTIATSINTNVDTKIAGIDTKLDEILSRLPVVNNISATDIEAQGAIVPFDASVSDSEPVLVEKKTLFGKTKWVEQK